MKIIKKRVRSVEKHLGFLKPNEKFYLGVKIIDLESEKLLKSGFARANNPGDTLLPPAENGTTSYFNANGKKVILTKKRMETAYRVVEWKWKDWGGHEHSKLIDVPYQRYPRKYIKPPSYELTITKNNLVIINKEFINNSESEQDIKHGINLLLEIFGECEVYSKELRTVYPQKIKRLNWEILPEGEYPWEKVKECLKENLSRVKRGNKPPTLKRLQFISEMNPDFVALGRAGFSGYTVFGFKNQNSYIFESVYYGNATYIFDGDWEELSKLSKAEILNNELQKSRVVHSENWEHRIREIFGKEDNLFSKTA